MHCTALLQGFGHQPLSALCEATAELACNLTAVAPCRALCRYIDALLSGVRGYLERGHATYVREQVNRNRSLAARGGDPDRLKDVQAYLAVRGRGGMSHKSQGHQLQMNCVQGAGEWLDLGFLVPAPIFILAQLL